jgi:hypothetical protein
MIPSLRALPLDMFDGGKNTRLLVVCLSKVCELHDSEHVVADLETPRMNCSPRKVHYQPSVDGTSDFCQGSGEQ